MRYIYLNAKHEKANNSLAIVTKELLLQIWYRQCYFHLTYDCQLWRENKSAQEQTIYLQNTDATMNHIFGLTDY